PNPTLFPYTTLFRSEDAECLPRNRNERQLDRHLGTNGNHGAADQNEKDVHGQRGAAKDGLGEGERARLLHESTSAVRARPGLGIDRKSTRLNSSHVA